MRLRALQTFKLSNCIAQAHQDEIRALRAVQLEVMIFR
jgi:hypothetical protein